MSTNMIPLVIFTDRCISQNANHKTVKIYEQTSMFSTIFIKEIVLSNDRKARGHCDGPCVGPSVNFFSQLYILNILWNIL